MRRRAATARWFFSLSHRRRLSWQRDAARLKHQAEIDALQRQLEALAVAEPQTEVRVRFASVAAARRSSRARVCVFRQDERELADKLNETQREKLSMVRSRSVVALVHAAFDLLLSCTAPGHCSN